jgi:hypothetical protein
MRFWLFPCLVFVASLALTGCVTEEKIAQFWRPISEPNLLMPTKKLQTKLDFDLSQCRCGIYPTNVTHQEIVDFQPDQQRLSETGVVVTPDDSGQCMVRPSLVITECMRHRGWEPTNCSGRMPLPEGGSLCAGYIPDATP